MKQHWRPVVEREHPGIAADAVMTEANLSDMVKDASHGEAGHKKVEDVSGIVENVIDDMDTDVKASESVMDASLGESEHEKQKLSRSDASGEIEMVTNDEEKSTVETTSGGIEKVTHSGEKSTVETTLGGIEKVTDCEEKSMVEPTVLPVVLKEQEDGNTDRGTPIETDEKSPEKRQGACLGESRLPDGSGRIEKDVSVGEQSTKELPAAKEETEVFGTIDSAMLVETEVKPLKEDNDSVHGETVTETEENTDALPPEQDERGNLETDPENLDVAEAGSVKRGNVAMQIETESENQKEQDVDSLDVTRDDLHVGQAEANRPERINTESKDKTQAECTNEVEKPIEDKSRHAEKEQEPTVEIEEATKEHHVAETLNQEKEDSISGQNEGSNQDISTDAGKLEVTSHPIVKADEIVEVNEIDVVPPSVEEQNLVAEGSGGGEDKDPSEVEEQRGEKLETTKVVDDSKMECGDSVVAPVADEVEVTKGSSEEGDVIHSSGVEVHQDEITEVTETNDSTNGCGTDVTPMVEEQEITAKSSMEEFDAATSETGMGNSIMEGQAAEKSIEERVTEPSEIVTEDLTMEEQVADPSETKAEDSTMEDQLAGKQQEPEVDAESSMKEDEPKASTDTGEDESSIPEQLAGKEPEQEISVETSMEEVDAEPSKTGVDDPTVQEVVTEKEQDQEVSAEIAMVEGYAKPSKSESVDLTINEHEAGKIQKDQEVTVGSSVEERESEPSKTLADDPTNILVSEKQEQEVAAESSMQETEAELSKTGVNDLTMEDQITGKEQLDQEVAAKVIKDSTSTEVGLNTQEQVGEQTQEQEVPLETSWEESETTLPKEADDPTSTEVGEQKHEQEVEQKQEQEVHAQTFKDETETSPSKAEADADDSTAKEQVAGKDQVIGAEILSEGRDGSSSGNDRPS
nr:ulp1 protease family, C-terminal catalytic domain-containing protein [Tanacetum cinerariifolium]